MRLRNVLLLSGVFLALAVYVLVFEKPPQSRVKPLSERLVLQLGAEGITAIAIELQDPPLRLEEVDGRWFVREPIALEADIEKVKDFVSQVVFLFAQRKISPNEGESLDLAEYGLEDSSKRVSLTTTAGEKVLILGEKTPLGNSMYARVEGRPEVYIIPGNFPQSLRKNPQDLKKVHASQAVSEALPPALSKGLQQGQIVPLVSGD